MLPMLRHKLKLGLITMQRISTIGPLESGSESEDLPTQGNKSLGTLLPWTLVAEAAKGEDTYTKIVPSMGELLSLLQKGNTFSQEKSQALRVSLSQGKASLL